MPILATASQIDEKWRVALPYSIYLLAPKTVISPRL